MALKTTLAAGLAALTLLFMPATQAEAKTKVVIGIGTPYVGGGYYYGGGNCWRGNWRCRAVPRYGYGYAPVRPLYYNGYGYGNGRMSCATARNVVDRNGYNNVRANECRGDIYSFTASRKGARYIVKVNARNGNIVSRGRI